jgi:hypothetical protein
LQQILLSPTASTAKMTADVGGGGGSSSSSAASKQAQGAPPLTHAALQALFRNHVAGFDALRYRSFDRGVMTFIFATYSNGLQMAAGNPALKEHTKQALRFVIAKLLPGAFPPVSDCERTTQLTKLAESFTGCQAEQARAIDYLYGQLSGREASLRDQALALLDRQKDTALEVVMLSFSPELAGSIEVPHVQNRYRIDIGEELGLPGVEAAKLDTLAQGKPPLSPSVRSKALERFHRCFSAEDYAKAVVADVNQQDVDAERFIMPKTLYEWASKSHRGFNMHSIFYDSDAHPDVYLGKPDDGNQFVAFIHLEVALEILERLFE